MDKAYVHGYDSRENRRLQDQANTLVELLHSDTYYQAGSRVLEAGCGVGAQTVTLARNSLQGKGGVGPSELLQMSDIMVIISAYFGAISPFLLSKRALLTGINGETYLL